MTQMGRNANDGTPTSFDVRSAAAFAFLGLALAICPPLAPAREDLSGPLLSVPTAASAARDLATEVHVRTALKEDEQLRSLSLRIKVTSGIAQLSGPVPSAELRRRVVHLVGQIPGVLRVQSAELYIAKARRPVKPLPLPLEGDKPTQTRSASPGPLSSAVGTLTGRDPLASSPAKPSPRTASAPRPVTLLAPEAATTPPRGPEPSRLTANPRPPPLAASLSAALERLRQGDARFRKIRTEVDGTTVRIIAGDTPGEHVMAFARAITRLPGVERVVVKDAPSSPR